jgi:hypothetical protein
MMNEDVDASKADQADIRRLGYIEPNESRSVIHLS